MDDTLYSASAGMFHDIHVLMDAYIVERLGLTSEQANELRKYYWRKYGVTYYGLWLHHGIDPHDFLTATHKVDTSSIHTQGRMREAIMSLKGQRILFTNAPNSFVDQVLERLNLSSCFVDQYRAEDMKVFGHWRPKPSAKMLKNVLACHHVKPHECCLVDDNLNNLKVAKTVGIFKRFFAKVGIIMDSKSFDLFLMLMPLSLIFVISKKSWFHQHLKSKNIGDQFF